MDETPSAAEVNFAAYYLESLISAANSGFYTREELIESYNEDGVPEDTAIIDRILAQAEANSVNLWEDPCYPKLERAFQKLNDSGIVAEMNYSCCGSCGHYEMAQDYKNKKDGYVFFNQQTGDSIYLNKQAWLGHGSLRTSSLLKKAPTDLEIAQRVVDTIRAEGLDVEWDGSHNSAILVQLPVWGKPIPTESTS